MTHTLVRDRTTRAGTAPAATARPPVPHRIEISIATIDGRI
jgi:hypothetical protein